MPGLRAAHRAARLALPHLKAGYSLRFAFLPSGEDPDSFIRSNGPAAMQKMLDEALPLSQVLWRVETEGKDFSTPERRAGLERALAEIVSAIGDGKIADYYRRDFEQRVFDAFKRRARAAAASSGARTATGYEQPRRALTRPRSFRPGGGETVSPAVKASLLARSGRNGAPQREGSGNRRPALVRTGARRAPWRAAGGAALHGPRRLTGCATQLLNLAASGSRLEKQGLGEPSGPSGNGRSRWPG